MKKLLIVAATALSVAFAGLTPAVAASSTAAPSFQVAQAKKDEMPAKGKKAKAKKKSAEKKADPEKKAKKAKGKKKADVKKT